MLAKWMKWLPYIIVERLAVRYCVKYEDPSGVIFHDTFYGRSIGIREKKRLEWGDESDLNA